MTKQTKKTNTKNKNENKDNKQMKKERMRVMRRRRMRRRENKQEEQEGITGSAHNQADVMLMKPDSERKRIDFFFLLLFLFWSLCDEKTCRLVYRSGPASSCLVLSAMTEEYSIMS